MKPTHLLIALFAVASYACPMAVIASDAENLLPNADFSGKFSAWVGEDYEDVTFRVLSGSGRLFRIEEEDGKSYVVLEPEGDFSALSGLPSILSEGGAKYILRYEVKSGLNGSRFIADLCMADENKTFLRSDSPNPVYQILNTGDWEKQEVGIIGQEGMLMYFRILSSDPEV